MITMAELIKDPTYKKFLTSKPRLPAVMRDPKRSSSPPWVVYVQKEVDGPWGKKEFWKYSEAFNFMKKALNKGVHDAAINCKRMGFEPPERLARIKGKYVLGSDNVRRQATKYVKWLPKLNPEDQEHHWCKYCRRPTIFKYYSRHKRLGSVSTDVPRCCICGASARIAVARGDRLYQRV